MSAQSASIEELEASLKASRADATELASQAEAKEATATALQAQLAAQMADNAISRMKLEGQLGDVRTELKDTKVRGGGEAAWISVVVCMQAQCACVIHLWGSGCCGYVCLPFSALPCHLL